MTDFDYPDFSRRMDGALEALKKEFTGLRTGRASTSLLDQIQIDAYGSKMPLDQVGTVGVPEPRLITVQVWDKALVSSVEAAIRESNLGLNPMSDGQFVRVPIPDLSAERREEISKIAHKYAEQAKVSVRNVRRDAMDQLKKMEKDGEIGQDDSHRAQEEVQKATDRHIGDMDSVKKDKEAEVLEV